jgi:hypothetical protein
MNYFNELNELALITCVALFGAGVRIAERPGGKIKHVGDF